MLKTFKKREVSSAKNVHIEGNKSGGSFIVILKLILMELQNLFFSTQMFVHLKQLFAHDFEDSFQVKKVVHLQYHMLLT